ncbi:hypothetical protein [Pseudomonas sp. NUPR-001]
MDTTAWFDNYKGMLAGESLLSNLQHMENQLPKTGWVTSRAPGCMS